MEYHLNWKKDGRDEQLSRAAKLHKLPVPKTVEIHPKVEQVDLIYWECFMDLCASRPVGHGMGYISWDSINAWAIRHKIVDADEFEMLRSVVGKMDHFWLDYFKAKNTPIKKPKPRLSK